jgi:AcrR family transcriptional regulator
LRDRKKDATRAAIEDAAWALFTEQGFDVTTVHQIADRANVAPRTFFRYFPTKEAVLYPELDELLVEMRRAFHERPADEPPLVSLIQAMDSISDELTSSKSRQMERFEMLKRSGMDGSSAFVNDRVVAAVADMVRERYAGQADGELRAQLAAGVLSTIMTISTTRWLEGGGDGDMEDEAKHCFDLVRALVASEAGDASPR